MKFSIRDLLLVTVIVALVLALAYTNRPQPVPAGGRYEMVLHESGNFMIDTESGKVWRLFPGGQWTSYDAPPICRKQTPALLVRPNPPKK